MGICAAFTHRSRRQSWGATKRAFFSGDSFLYTSKEKSYPLLRRRSGSSGFKDKTAKAKALDSGFRRNDERELPAPPQEEWKPLALRKKQAKTLDSGFRRNDERELPAPPQEE